MRYTIPFLFFVTAICSCTNEPIGLHKFDDPESIKIADLQDRRAGDSLKAYLENINPSYRSAAALAYASVQDSAFIPHLRKLILEDFEPTVRMAAAYAIGQTPSSISERVLAESISKEKNNVVLAEAIESYGKVCTSWKLNLSFQDSVLSAAIAWAHYRTAVRGVSDGSMNKNASEFLKSPYRNTRLAAAHYFARGAKDFDQFQSVLISSAKQDKFADVRMAATIALRKIKSDSARLSAEYLAKNDTDYRVRVNAARALQEYPFALTKDVLIPILMDSNVNVGIAASETIKSAVTAEHAPELNEIAHSIKNWRIQANLYEAGLTVTNNHQELSKEIQSVYNRSTNPYQKAALLTALQHAPSSNIFLKEQLLVSSEPVIKISAASALVGMNSSEKFDQSLKVVFAETYREAIADGDVAVIGIIANALVDSTLGYKSVIKDFDFLKDARSKLSLPKDFEAIAPLEAAIAYFEGGKAAPLKNDFNHPIPWSMVKRIPGDQKALIKTSRGNITIRLFVDETPGSVANFVTLASKKYYDGKFFHRVAPNFVVQGGCPRGDGWGSEAYSIRSEFSSRRYKTGSIGMASAGKDTEGTQWFITHSATPHLEGRYSLFAEVVEGMDVVHKIEVGDTIISVEIIDLQVL